MVLLAFHLKSRDLAPKSLNEHAVGISVYDRLIFYIARPACVFNRAETLFIVAVTRANTSDHGGARVAAKTVLEDTGQLAITVRYVVHLAVFLFVSQGRDDVSKCVEPFVDTYTLLHELAGSSCFFYSFGPCQVNEMKLSTDVLFTGCRLSARLLDQRVLHLVYYFLIDRDCENCVRAAAPLIH